MVGRLAEYACSKGIKKTQLTIDDFREVFDISLIKSNIQIGEELD